VNAKLAQIGQFVIARIPWLLAEAEDQIQAAIDAAVEAANEADEPKAVVLTLPINVKWNLDTNSVEVAIAVAVKRKFESVGKLEDPNQPTLPMTDSEGDALPPQTAEAVQKLAKDILARDLRAGKVTVTVGGAN
jgi:hypothetical protein